MNIQKRKIAKEQQNQVKLDNHKKDKYCMFLLIYRS